MPKDTSKNFENIIKEFSPDLELKEVEEKLYFLFSRRSCRKFDSEKTVPDSILSIIVHSGMFAPNSGNIQNWEFIILKKQEDKNKIVDFCYNQNFLSDASTIIILLANLKEAKNYFKEKAELFSIINVSMAAENMLLSANILNVGSLFSAVSDEEGLKDNFNIPSHVKVIGVIALGYCNETPQFNDRKKAIETIYLHKYGLKFKDIDLVLYNPRILDRIKKYASTTLPVLKEELLEKTSKYKFELLHKELLLKNRQIKSLKEELEKLHLTIIKKSKKEGPWSYFILKKVKGIKYPILESEKKELLKRVYDVSIKGIPMNIIIEKISYPINNHKELLKKIRKVLEELKVVKNKEDKKEDKKRINEYNEDENFIFVKSLEQAQKKLFYYSKKNENNILIYYNTKKGFLKDKEKIKIVLKISEKEFLELYEKGILEKKNKIKNKNNNKNNNKNHSIKIYFRTVRNYKDKSTKNIVFTLKNLIKKIDFKVHNKIIVLEKQQ